MPMMTMLRTITVLGFLSILLSATFVNCGPSAKRSCDFDKADVMTGVLCQFAMEDQIFPLTLEGFGVRCVNTTNAINNLREFVESCMEGVSKQVLKLTLNSVKAEITPICSEKGREEMVAKHTKCLHTKYAPLHKCFKSLIRDLESTLQNLPEEDHFSGICCSYEELRKCFGTVINNGCSESQLDFVYSLMESVLGDLLSLLCEEEESPENCNKLYEVINANPFSGPLPKSFLPALIRVLSPIG